jgi:Flp pilus assembly protein TadG
MFMQPLKDHIKSFLRGDFARDEEGMIAIEAMIILPMMFWTFLSLFSIFDSFRAYSINQKAAFTIGDAISRETQPIDDDYLTGMWQMFDYLAQTRLPSALRVTALQYDEGQSRFEVDWSQSRGWATGLGNNDINNNAATTQEWKDKLPIIPDGERIMLVETWDRYDPPFATGLEMQEIRNFVFTRPRYAPRVCWQTCN